MRPDPTKDVMAALLQILEGVERPADEVPASTLGQFSESEARSEAATPATAGQSANPYAERIAAAMMKLRVQAA
jgi:hypothetical protein